MRFTTRRIVAAFAIAASFALGAYAYAGGQYTGFPQYGNTQNTNTPPGSAYSTTCLSFGNNNVCNQYQPWFPYSYLTGSETFYVDSNYANNQPNGFTLPLSAFASGFGGTTVFTTSGTTASVQVADGISRFIYSSASAATFTSFKLPPNPMNNQDLCLTNSGTASGALTITAVAASANIYGNTPTIVGVSPTLIPVMVASGAAGTYVQGSDCWTYIAGASNNGVWYRTQ